MVFQKELGGLTERHPLLIAEPMIRLFTCRYKAKHVDYVSY
jgi:hypothetical protein